MNYFYGPVPSRRLGFSLGVDLIPKKTCSFNCLYCQLNQEAKKKTKRNFYVDLAKLKAELKEIIKKKPRIDYITVSGSGEPTLHKDLDKIVRAIKNVTKNKYPVCIITNSSLLYRKKVRDELRKVDLIIPSLDASRAKTFCKINRPHKAINFKNVLDGLIKLRREFKGKIWLEIMLIKGINDNQLEAKAFRKIIDKVKPDKIQLNFPIRPAAIKLSLPSRKKVKELKKIMAKDIEIISDFDLKKKSNKISKGLKKQILRFLKVRPATLEDLINSLDANPQKIRKQIKNLLTAKQINKKKRHFVSYD